MSSTTAEKPQLPLKHHLKQLNLPTFLAECQAQECALGGVDHVRYLLRLAEMEFIERERRMVDRYFSRLSTFGAAFVALAAIKPEPLDDEAS